MRVVWLFFPVSSLATSLSIAWRLNRVEIVVAAENRRSRTIRERLGFREEGTLLQCQLGDGRYLDCVSYSTLAADWLGVG